MRTLNCRTSSRCLSLVSASLACLLVSAASAAAQNPTEEIVPGGDVVTYIDTDAIGSVRMVTDANGVVVARYDYLPFGTPWNPSAFPSNRLFAGKEHDTSTGLDYMGARYFEDQLGRFTQPDFSFADQNLFDPQSWNLYHYARNNPLRFIDPTGRETECIPAESTVCVTAPLPGDPDLDAWHRWLSDSFGRWSGALDTIHTGLDIAGLVPGAGEFADLANSGLYLLQGDKFNAGISLAGLIPISGQFITGTRAGRKAASASTGISKELIERATRGRDGGVSRIIKERRGADTISITHQVELGGNIIHQHQTHIGVYGSERVFPDAWVEYPTILTQRRP